MDQFVSVGNVYLKKGFAVIAISSNDVDIYRVDSPDKMKELGVTKGFNFPYCYDESQSVAKLYKAACTPDFSVFNGHMECVYRRQLDDSRPGNNTPVTGQDIRHVLDCILEDKAFNMVQKPSIGCNIKWK